MSARIKPEPIESADHHLRQDVEANQFAIKLLAPVRRLRRYLHRTPDLARVLEIADAFEISREAAARRYVEQHRESLAVLFGQHDRIIYLRKAPGVLVDHPGPWRSSSWSA
ncbi:ImmA/IrrE family metallo-endopeptidase [Minwuia thermotolerans]|uniref:Uncharacterized protein n=1 Tax=Minwuia thermotolerans TaxID=2056226 RepID=A0A2M9FV89_9PROT|nr:ImmA/IrrE family metallo-endopeptidase [Minwuia thermotolerans]PJK27390.1 hypothetical protein CVT23_22495 [Minwuia thermotolerans]